MEAVEIFDALIRRTIRVRLSYPSDGQLQTHSNVVKIENVFPSLDYEGIIITDNFSQGICLKQEQVEQLIADNRLHIRKIEKGIPRILDVKFINE